MALSDHIRKDTPTNNFATLNPLAADSDAIISNGNLSFSRGGSTSGWLLAPVSIVLTEGKYYCEYTVTGSSIGLNHSGVGTIDPDDRSNYGGFSAGTVRFLDDGGIRDSTGTIYSGGTDGAFSSGTVIGLMFDVDANTCDYYRDGTFKYQVTGLLSKILITGLPWHNANLPDYHFNFGQDPTFGGNKTPSGGTNSDGSYPDKSGTGIGGFFYDPPAGAKALCTANLSEMTPTVDDDTPQDYFKSVKYTGVATNSGNFTVPVGFQSDLIWIKRRNNGNSHNLFDSVRGFDHWLASDYTGAERNNTSNNSGNPKISTVNSSGFTVHDNFNAEVNESGGTYVAWCWKAGGAPSGSTSTTGSAKRINTSGTQDDTSCSALATAATNAGASNVITPPLMSINQAAGFSIVKYNGNGTSDDVNYSIPHGLSYAPDVVIVKNLDLGSQSSGISWPVLFTNIGGIQGLDGTSGVESGELSNNWGGSYPNANTFSVRRPSISSETNKYRTMGAYNYIAYCWHSVEGYSKFGSYTGNGSADGPFVYCGFRPAFMMVKRTSGTFSATDGLWTILDSTRRPFNGGAPNSLYANDSSVEFTGSANRIDFLSNGFKLTDTNNNVNSTEEFIFMAFAEQPFNYANAR